MILLLKLLIAHLIGDFVFQPKSWVDDKKTRKIRARSLYLHIALHAIALMLFLEFDTQYWLGFVIIVISHFILDLLKLYVQTRNTQTFWFFTDQVLHLSVLYIVANIYTDVAIPWREALSPQGLLLTAAVITVTWVCSVIILVIISRWDPQIEDSSDHSLSNAGKFIGMLERLLIFIFIVTGNWIGVGFLLAAKSIFRFGDLREARDRKLTEYILIGSLLSFGLAIAVSLIYIYLKQLT